MGAVIADETTGAHQGGDMTGSDRTARNRSQNTNTVSSERTAQWEGTQHEQLADSGRCTRRRRRAAAQSTQALMAMTTDLMG
jgi:hypothetical protein